MSDHRVKLHPVAALIVVLLIALLTTLLLSVMNEGHLGAAIAAGVLFAVFGAVVVLVIGSGADE